MNPALAAEGTIPFEQHFFRKRLNRSFSAACSVPAARQTDEITAFFHKKNCHLAYPARRGMEARRSVV
jgi:hypothetical protein